GAAFTLASKDLRVAWSYRLSFLFGHFAVFAPLVLFYFVSRVVGNSSVVGSPEHYFRFIVVGTAMAGLVDTAVGAAMGAARRDQIEGTLEAIASLPVSSGTLGLGWLLYPMFDALLGLVVAFIVALPLGMWGVHPCWPTVFLSIVLSIAVFASFGFIGAAIVMAFQQGAGTVPLILAGLALLSGVLFPVSVMPHWMQVLSHVSPLRHSLDSLRDGMLEHASIHEAGNSLLVLAGFAVVLLPLSLVLLELGLRRARKTGGLSRF
ncbi:MAG: ABC transporter permease, partial [Solirubrobacteraceae bacterium]